MNVILGRVVAAMGIAGMVLGGVFLSRRLALWDAQERDRAKRAQAWPN